MFWIGIKTLDQDQDQDQDLISRLGSRSESGSGSGPQNQIMIRIRFWDHDLDIDKGQHQDQDQDIRLGSRSGPQLMVNIVVRIRIRTSNKDQDYNKDLIYTKCIHYVRYGCQKGIQHIIQLSYDQILASNWQKFKPKVMRWCQGFCNIYFTSILSEVPFINFLKLFGTDLKYFLIL